MANEVTFPIKLLIDGKEHLVEATADVKKLAKELEGAKTEGNKLRDELLKFNQAKEAFDNLLGSLHQVTGAMQDCIDANTQQAEAETKLTVNMRNMMNATDAEVESIKALCSAQQELGVIGDEVQMAGAQELATYLQKKSSLEELIPVMNDMLAQQYGLNANQEEAATIAQMLGKVMEGQVGALSRYGYYFDEAQEQVLKFGTEEERAAMLVEVVESAVGGMNAELAKTDAGKAKQAANAFGDIKEAVGSALAPLENFLVKLGGFGTAINGLVHFSVGIKGTVVAAKEFGLVSQVASAAQTVWNYQMRLGKQAHDSWTASAYRAAAGAAALRLAILGLMAVSGLGLAFAAASLLMGGFGKKSKEVANTLKDTKTATETAGDAANAAVAKYKLLQSEWQKLDGLKEKNKWIKDHAGVMQELGLAVGGVADAEKVFVEMSDKVVAAIRARAEANALEGLFQETYKETFKKNKEAKENADKLAKQKYVKEGQLKGYDGVYTFYNKQEAARENMRIWSETNDALMKEQARNELQLKQIENDFVAAQQKAARLEAEIAGSKGRNSGGNGSNGSNGNDDQEEEERKREEKWQKEMKAAEDARKKAALKAAEEEQTLREKEIEDMHRYLEEYGSYEQKRLAITEEYEAKIRAAKNPWEAESLKAEMKEQISAAKLDEVKSEMDWEGLFNNLDRYSANFLQGIRGRLQELLRSGELDAKDSEIVAQKLEEIDKVVIEKSGSTFRWINEYLAEQKRLQEEAAQAASEADAARARKAGAMAGLDGARDQVEQLKANGVAKNSLEMQTALNELARAEAEAASATAELTKAEGKQTNAEAKLNVPLKEKVAGWLQGVNENVEKYLGDVPELFEQLGWGDIANRVQSGIDGVNQAAGAAADFATGNYVGALSKGISAITSFAGIFGGNGNIEENNRNISELTMQSKVLAEEMKRLKDTIANGTLAESLEAYAKALDTKRAQENVDQARIGEEAGKWQRGTHSVNSMLMNDDAMRGMMGRVSDIIGRNVDQMWHLTGDELQKVLDTDSSLYADVLKRIQGSENSKTGQNIAGMIEELRQTYAGVEEELNQMEREATVTVTFDSVKSRFASILKDMGSDVDDFGEHIEKTLAEAFLNRKIQDMYSEQLEDWYKGFSDAMEDGNLSKEEVETLKNGYRNIVEDAMRTREELKGLGLDMDEGTSQTGRAGGFSAMSQDQGTKLEGMFTSGLIHWASMDEKMEDVSDRMGRAADRLARIEEHTGRSAELLKEIKEQGDKMLRDGVRVK